MKGLGSKMGEGSEPELCRGGQRGRPSRKPFLVSASQEFLGNRRCEGGSGFPA